jgi:NADPH:quinone reductase-like Zn-dependent oxidoreductase
MRCYEIRDDFGLEHLTLAERPDPDVGAGEVRLEMKAWSPNYRDILMIQGAYNPNQPLPLIPFSDAVGEVVEVGEGVDRVSVGDRVCPIFARDWVAGRPTKKRLKTALGGPLDGTLTEQMVLPDHAVVEVPDYLTDAEAATLPCAGVTAWNALLEQGDVTAGDTVATLGTGGVSSFALLFAKAAGAEVIITSSQDAKLEQMAQRGADAGINYEDVPEWGSRIKELTGGVGADHIVEVGGANTLEQSVRGVRIGGRISLIGVLSGTIEDFNVIPVLMQNIRIQGVIVGHREMFENMCHALAANEIHPVVDASFGFDEVHDALNYVIEGRHIGKVAIEAT